MLDNYNRKIDYLRISITDRCNLRCVYCMPECGIETVSHNEILSYDEIIRVCKIAANMGIKKIKITGGEPLVRKNVPELVKNIKAIDGIEEVTLTTNGVLLGDVLDELVKYNIDGINISLDTLDENEYKKITRFDVFSQVRENIFKALQYPDLKVKINCVPIKNQKQNLIRIAQLAKENNIHIRFIEMMPVGYGKRYEYLSEESIISLLTESEDLGELKPYDKILGNGPCHYYQIDGFKGKIGFISALSHQFCADCNRIRLTSQGFLKTCLQYETGADIKELLRNDSDDAVIKSAIQNAILKKPKEHAFLTQNFNDTENQSGMNKIGG